jgi:phosphoribosylanthranilate isomerase
MDTHGMAQELIRAMKIEERLSLIVSPLSQNFIQLTQEERLEYIRDIKKLILMKWMRVFFQYYGQKRKEKIMFEEEEPKKAKPLDVDELSVEEIELMIKDHEEQILNLKVLLKQKKEKLELASGFFKKN